MGYSLHVNKVLYAMWQKDIFEVFNVSNMYAMWQKEILEVFNLINIKQEGYVWNNIFNLQNAIKEAN